MRSRTWFLLTLLLLAAAVWLWRRGDEEIAKRGAKGAVAGGPATVDRSASSGAGTNQSAAPSVSSGATSGTGPGAAMTNAPGRAASGQGAYRLTNTSKSAAELGRSDTAVLLENAFIDTASATPWEVPEHLRATGDPGSYIVQSRGPLDAGFYVRLQEAGAAFVSYIPNNA